VLATRKAAPGSRARAASRSRVNVALVAGRSSRFFGSWIRRWRSVSMVPYLRPNSSSRGAITADTARIRHSVRIHSCQRSAQASRSTRPGRGRRRPQDAARRGRSRPILPARGRHDARFRPVEVEAQPPVGDASISARSWVTITTATPYSRSARGTCRGSRGRSTGRPPRSVRRQGPPAGGAPARARSPPAGAGRRRGAPGAWRDARRCPAARRAPGPPAPAPPAVDAARQQDVVPHGQEGQQSARLQHVAQHRATQRRPLGLDEARHGSRRAAGGVGEVNSSADVGVSTSASRSSSVLLPQPLSPTTARNSPARTSSSGTRSRKRAPPRDRSFTTSRSG